MEFFSAGKGKMSFPIGMVSARGACPCLLIQTKQQPLVLRAEAQGGNQGYGGCSTYWEWDPVKGHMTNGTPANGISDVDDGAACCWFFYADAESIETVEAGR